MKIKGLIDEDIVNYKKCSMYIIFPFCSFKCGKNLCQNSELAKAENIEMKVEDICERYANNHLSEAIVLGGLEPLDSPFDLLSLIGSFRYNYNIEDDIVIYTGYTEEELTNKENTKLYVLYQNLHEYKNIIIKFGRYIPGGTPRFDETLGVTLVSNNQYGKKIS